MSKNDDIYVRRNDKGYFMLYVKGQFNGNYDTFTEAWNEGVLILRELEDIL